MADTKISALTAVPSASAADVFAVVQGGTTKKETLTQLQATVSSTNLAVSGSCTAVQFSGTNITTDYIVVPAISGTNLAVSYATITTSIPTSVSATNLAVSGSATAVQFSGTNITVNYIIPKNVSVTNLAVSTILASPAASVTNLAATGILSSTQISVATFTAGSVSAGNGATGAYSSGELTISNGIVTAIP